MTTKITQRDDGGRVTEAGFQLGLGGTNQQQPPPTFSFRRSRASYPDATGIPDLADADVVYVPAFAILNMNATTMTVFQTQNISSSSVSAATGSSNTQISFTYNNPFENTNSLRDYTVIANAKLTESTTVDPRVAAAIFRRGTSCQVITTTRTQSPSTCAVISVVCFQK